MKPILEDLASNTLSMDEYPSILPMPELAPVTNTNARRGGASARKSTDATSARKTAGPSDRWSKSSGAETKKSAGPATFTGGRFVVFMMGGLSYPELRVANEVMENTTREFVVDRKSVV